jgi:hypothetical protein
VRLQRRDFLVTSYFPRTFSSPVVLARQYMDFSVLRSASLEYSVGYQSLPMICAHSQKVQEQTSLTRPERVPALLCQAVMKFRADAHMQIFRTPCQV